LELNLMPDVEQLGPDLVWDDQVRGLCVRVFGNGSQSFLFVYRLDDRQHFIRIGKTPTWSIEAARDKAKYFRSIIDQGDDPARYNRERERIGPVENVIQYIAENLRK
jgi:Arm DNA-binding domain